MRTLTKLLAISFALFSFSSCATIFSSGKYPVQLNSTPSGATVVVANKDGVEVFKGTTPATASLKSSNGFFKKGSYRVTFSKVGYDSKTFPISASIDGWYFGNILLGGVIGMLIVDPATGAMYKLDTEYVDCTLDRAGNASVDSPKLQVYELESIPADWVDHLQLLKL